MSDDRVNLLKILDHMEEVSPTKDTRATIYRDEFRNIVLEWWWPHNKQSMQYSTQISAIDVAYAKLDIILHSINSAKVVMIKSIKAQDLTDTSKEGDN